MGSGMYTRFVFMVVSSMMLHNVLNTNFLAQLASSTISTSMSTWITKVVVLENISSMIVIQINGTTLRVKRTADVLRWIVTCPVHIGAC